MDKNTARKVITNANMSYYDVAHCIYLATVEGISGANQNGGCGFALSAIAELWNIRGSVGNPSGRTKLTGRYKGMGVTENMILNAVSQYPNGISGSMPLFDELISARKTNNMTHKKVQSTGGVFQNGFANNQPKVISPSRMKEFDAELQAEYDRWISTAPSRREDCVTLEDLRKYYALHPEEKCKKVYEWDEFEDAGEGDDIEVVEFTSIEDMMEYMRARRERINNDSDLYSNVEQIEKEEQEIDKLNRDIAAPMDDEYIIRVAREKLNLYFPDETIFYGGSK